MDWLGNNHMGTPTDTHATKGEACFLCVVRAEGVQLSVGDSHGKFVLEEELEINL
jgi:hypothetical protein